MSAPWHDLEHKSGDDPVSAASRAEIVRAQEAEEDEYERRLLAVGAGTSGPRSPALHDRSSRTSPAGRSPLSVLELHLLAVREGVDRITDEHALMLRILREASADGALAIRRAGIPELARPGDPEFVTIDDWCSEDLDPAEATILRSLLRADV